MSSKDFRSRIPIAMSRYLHVVAFALVGMVIGGSAMFIALHIAAVHLAQQQLEEAVDAYVLPASSPVLLRIPKINLETPFGGSLGLNDDQTIEVPKSFTEVGWYQYSPTPGERGPSVVLGHVDSYQGPAVFFDLKELTEGDDIFIERKDGSIAHFIVVRLEQHTQDNFPTESVYGDIEYAGLRLVTCTGIYDHHTLRYSHNLIVFARLVEA